MTMLNNGSLLHMRVKFQKMLQKLIFFKGDPQEWMTVIQSKRKNIQVIWNKIPLEFFPLIKGWFFNIGRTKVSYQLFIFPLPDFLTIKGFIGIFLLLYLRRLWNVNRYFTWLQTNPMYVSNFLFLNFTGVSQNKVYLIHKRIQRARNNKDLYVYGCVTTFLRDFENFLT